MNKHYVAKNQRGAVRNTGQKRVVEKFGLRNTDTTVYIHLSMSVVDFVYEKYPGMALAGAIEKFLTESASLDAGGTRI